MDTVRYFLLNLSINLCMTVNKFSILVLNKEYINPIDFEITTSKVKLLWIFAIVYSATSETSCLRDIKLENSLGNPLFKRHQT